MPATYRTRKADDQGLNITAVIMILVIVALPILLGAAVTYFRKPWWWAAVAAVLVSLAVAILPEPEAGEPRVAVGDLLFLAVASVVVVALVWLGSLLGRRTARRRNEKRTRRTRQSGQGSVPVCTRTDHRLSTAGEVSR